MSLGIDTAKMLYRNMDALTWIFEPRQSSGLSQNERAAMLNAILVTAEAGRKLAEAVLVDAMTENYKSGGNAVDRLSMSTTVGAVAEEMNKSRVTPGKGGGRKDTSALRAYNEPLSEGLDRV